jgi:hypothetical protein
VDRIATPELRWQRQAHLATILGAIVTAGSMVFGVLTYQRSAAEQRQVSALGVLQEYLKLTVEHPDLASRSDDQPVNARYGWFATHALFTAETLWGLVGNDPRWERAIVSILRQHRGYLEQGVFTCGDYSPEFVKYIRTRVPALKCAS